MNKIKVDHIIKILESWEKAYLSPSATMAIKDAKEVIESLAQEINMLEVLVEEQKQDIASMKKALEPKFPVQPKKVKKNEQTTA